MTLIEWARKWWHRTGPPSARPPAALNIERHTQRVPAEYQSLHVYLDRRYASVVVLTFEQIEALVGFTLPAAARTDREWWTGAVARSHRHAEAWVSAGRTATPNFPARTVTFYRVSDAA